MKKINIAIDGKSATGKSTLAKLLARKLGYLYIDSGAMYRAITFYLLRNGIQPVKVEPDDLQGIRLSFGKDGIELNGEPVEQQIRTMEVADYVSEVAAIPIVRDFCVWQQQEIGRDKGVVMDGRDIGTVVFPDAEVKIFLSADEMTRVQRRFAEIGRGTLEEVRENLEKRDRIDSERTYHPLLQAEDALFIDNSEMSPEEQARFILGIAQKKIREA